MRPIMRPMGPPMVRPMVRPMPAMASPWLALPPVDITSYGWLDDSYDFEFYPTTDLFPLQRSCHYGRIRNAPCPKKSHAVLTRMYGENWTRPVACLNMGQDATGTFYFYSTSSLYPKCGTFIAAFMLFTISRCMPRITKGVICSVLATLELELCVWVTAHSRAPRTKALESAAAYTWGTGGSLV